MDGCGCFPTGRHYPGIAHLTRAIARGTAQEFAADLDWEDVPIAMLDVETTGLESSTDRVIELGIVVGRRGAIVAQQNWLLNPGRPINPEASAVHGITDADVADKPTFEAVAHEIAALLTGAVPAAYNAPFDRAFLRAEFGRVAGMATAVPPALRTEVEWIDPLVWAREIFRDEKSRSLGNIAARLGIALENAHRAADDATAALQVLNALARDPRVPRPYGAFIQEQRRLALLHADERRRWRG
jgi:DNA polymerase-3 subunit epsilon